MNLSKQIQQKIYSSEPTFGTYEDTLRHSQLPGENIFPFPFYFVSNPFSEEPRVYDRRAGWNPQQYFPSPVIPKDPYPQHCFQPPCNTTLTVKKTDEGCVNQKCITLDR